MTGNRRKAGIDLLRIVSMCMIIVIHMNGYGKASEMIDAFSLKYFCSRIFVFFVACSVNVYAMISGYVGCTKTTSGYSVRKFLKLWSWVLFYSVFLMMLFKIIYPEQIGRRQMIEAVFPAMSMQYWYFTCYIPVLFLMPYLNIFITKMDIISMRKLINLLFLLFSVIPWVFQTDWFGLDDGFSAFWLIILYLFGAWIRKEMEETESLFAKWKKSRLLFALAGLILIQVLLRYTLDKVGVVIGADSGLMHDFGSYTSPFIVMEACVMLLLFAKLEISQVKCSTIISQIGAASFGVYLIHDNQFVRQYIMMDRFVRVGQLNPIAYVFAMLGGAVGIYVCCAAVELVRKFVGCGIKNMFVLIRQRRNGIQ